MLFFGMVAASSISENQPNKKINRIGRSVDSYIVFTLCLMILLQNNKMMLSFKNNCSRDMSH